MMDNAGRKLSLDRPAPYQIKVPGHLDESWADWVGGLTITVEDEKESLVDGVVNTVTDQGLPSRGFRLIMG